MIENINIEGHAVYSCSRNHSELLGLKTNCYILKQNLNWSRGVCPYEELRLYGGDVAVLMKTWVFYSDLELKDIHPQHKTMFGAKFDWKEGCGDIIGLGLGGIESDVRKNYIWVI